MIVGGGVSGLSAAYLLQHLDFLLLEKEPHWGGNAYIMEYQGSAYATGSAFLDKSEYAYAFAKEIGLEPLPVNNRDGSIINGECDSRYLGRWPRQIALPSRTVREGFKKFKKEMLAIDLRKTRARNSSTFPFPIS